MLSTIALSTFFLGVSAAPTTFGNALPAPRLAERRLDQGSGSGSGGVSYGSGSGSLYTVDGTENCDAAAIPVFKVCQRPIVTCDEPAEYVFAGFQQNVCPEGSEKIFDFDECTAALGWLKTATQDQLLENGWPEYWDPPQNDYSRAFGLTHYPLLESAGGPGLVDKTTYGPVTPRMHGNPWYYSTGCDYSSGQEVLFNPSTTAPSHIASGSGTICKKLPGFTGPFVFEHRFMVNGAPEVGHARSSPDWVQK